MSKRTQSVLLWDNPRHSGVVLTSILLGLVTVKHVNVLAWTFRILSSSLLLLSGVDYLSQGITGSKLNLVSRLCKGKCANGCIGDAAVYYAPHVATVIKKLEGELIDLFNVKDTSCTLYAGLIAFVGFAITGTISLWNLLFFGTILAFSVPKLYKSNKVVIDKQVDNAQKVASAKYVEISKGVNEKYGDKISKAKEVAAPLVKLVQDKFAAKVRTAGSTVEEDVASAGAEATTSAANAHETEIDFNNLGERLKKEALEATSDAKAFTHDKIGVQHE